MDRHDWDAEGWPAEGEPTGPGRPDAPPDNDSHDDHGAFAMPGYGDVDAVHPAPDDDPGWHAAAHHAELGFADGDDTDSDDTADDDVAAGTPVAGTPGALGVPVGTDPDLLPHADDGSWAERIFPPELVGFDRPEPVDGYPWADPTLLGIPDRADVATSTAADAAWPDPTPADVAAYDGTQLPPGVDAWAALRASPDPATSALARWWAPG